MRREVLQILTAARSHEEAGRYPAAEAEYLRARDAIDALEKQVKGTVSISLGHVARRGGRVTGAISYYREAIDYLEGATGEALLESAYAHFNIARLLLADSDRRAVHYCDGAVKRFARYPYTAPADLINAKTLRVVAEGHTVRRVSEKRLRDTWAALRAEPFASLDTEVVMNFLLILFGFLRKLRPDEFDAALGDLIAWDNRVANEVVALLDGRDAV